MYPYSEMIILQHATRNMFIPCPDGAHSSKPGSQVPTTPKVRLQLPHADWHASISVCGPHIAAGRAAHSAFYSMHFTFLACAAMHFFFSFESTVGTHSRPLQLLHQQHHHHHHGN